MGQHQPVGSRPDRPEATLKIHAWLEEREIEGLCAAFRARVSQSTSATTIGVGSITELHRALDEALRDAGLLRDAGQELAP